MDDIFIIILKFHLQIQARILCQVSARVAVLCSEYRGCFEYPFIIGGNKHLFVKLWALREIGFLIEVFYFKHIAAAFTRRSKKFGSVNLQKIMLPQVLFK